MGTRKSKHNKGRKPFYKDHRVCMPEEVSFPDPAISDPRRRRTTSLQSCSRAAPRSVDTFTLEAQVEAYIAKRREESERLRVEKRKLDEFNSVVLGGPSLRAIVWEPRRTEPVGELSISKSDCLMQLYRRGVIHDALFGTGRRWQLLYHKACLQSSKSVDWGATSRSALRYQCRGGLSDLQIHAMSERARFCMLAGNRIRSWLDLLLDEGVGVDDLSRISGMSVDRAAEFLVFLLRRAAKFFADERVLGALT